MKSDSFCKLSWKPCWQFDDWTQMTSFSQIVRLYRVSERPNTGQKGHNQAWKAKIRPKGDKRAISSHVTLFFLRHTILPCLHNFPMASKPRVRLSLFLSVCLVLCSCSFSFCFKRGFISSWSWQFVHRFLCLYWTASTSWVIFSGIIRFTFVNDDFNFRLQFRLL